MMRGIFIKKWREETGQAMVEMAIALPILLTLICGIIDFGYIATNKMIVTNASREGARYGAINATVANFQTVVGNRIKSVMPEPAKSASVVTVTLSNPSIPRDGDVTANVSYTFNFLTPLTPVLLGKQTFTATAKTQMKCE